MYVYVYIDTYLQSRDIPQPTSSYIALILINLHKPHEPAPKPEDLKSPISPKQRKNTTLCL